MGPPLGNVTPVAWSVVMLPGLLDNPYPHRGVRQGRGAKDQLHGGDTQHQRAAR